MSDEDDVTHEYVDFRARAQALVQLLFGTELNPRDYKEKLDIVEQEMRDVFNLAHAFVQTQFEDGLISTIPPPPDYKETVVSASAKHTRQLKRK